MSADYITAFVDGAARNQGSPNPTEAACAFAVYKAKREMAHFVRGLGSITNNAAEYHALIDCLLYCSALSLPFPIIYTDSLIVHNQVNHIWNCNDENLLPLYMTVMEIQEVYNFKLVHVSRKQTFIPDGLCNAFLDKLALAKKKLKPRYRPKKVETNAE